METKRSPYTLRWVIYIHICLYIYIYIYIYIYSRFWVFDWLPVQHGLASVQRDGSVRTTCWEKPQDAGAHPNLEYGNTADALRVRHGRVWNRRFGCSFLAAGKSSPRITAKVCIAWITQIISKILRFGSVKTQLILLLAINVATCFDPQNRHQANSWNIFKVHWVNKKTIIYWFWIKRKKETLFWALAHFLVTPKDDLRAFHFRLQVGSDCSSLLIFLQILHLVVTKSVKYLALSVKGRPKFFSGLTKIRNCTLFTAKSFHSPSIF